MDDGNKIELDASMARIYIESSSGGGDYALVCFCNFEAHDKDG